MGQDALKVQSSLLPQTRAHDYIIIIAVEEEEHSPVAEAESFACTIN